MQPKKFSDLGIKVQRKNFVGEKIKIHKILNVEIMVHAYYIKPSKYPEKGSQNCLWMQISMAGTKYVVFSIAKLLMETLQNVQESNFPFVTTIVKNDEMYEFT